MFLSLAPFKPWRRNQKTIHRLFVWSEKILQSCWIIKKNKSFEHNYYGKISFTMLFSLTTRNWNSLRSPSLSPLKSSILQHPGARLRSLVWSFSYLLFCIMQGSLRSIVKSVLRISPRGGGTISYKIIQRTNENSFY